MNCCICGTVKNVGPYLDKIFSNIEKIGALFENYVIIFYYDHSKWDKTNYFGGSLLSFYNMLKPLGYSLVYTEVTGTDAFFVKNEIISKKNLYFENINDVAKIYNSPKYGLGPDGGHPPDQFDRSYFTADQACFFIGESLYGQ